MFLTRRLAVLAVPVAGLALVLPVGWPLSVMTMSALLAVFTALDIRFAPAPGGLRFKRTAVSATEVGMTTTVTCEVRNPTSRPLWVRVHDASPLSLGRNPDRMSVVLGVEETALLSGSITPSRRGLAQLGPATIRTLGPLGLAGRQGVVADQQSLKVYPPLPGKVAAEARIERGRSLQVGEHSSAVRGGGTEFDSLHEYHRDDEFRRINWRATARSVNAMANHYREERDQQLLILVDASRMMAATVAGRPRYDHAVDTAHTLSELATRIGDRVGMATFASGVIAMASPSGGRRQSGRILDLLFDVRPTLEAPDYRGAFASILSRYRRRALLVLLTELADSEAMEPLMTAVPALRARHLVVVGATTDPALVEMSRAVPRTSEDAYLKAAAEATVLERQKAAARLRAMGVQVEDRLPGSLSPAIADRYLDIKASGRL